MHHSHTISILYLQDFSNFFHSLVRILLRIVRRTGSLVATPVSYEHLSALVNLEIQARLINFLRSMYTCIGKLRELSVVQRQNKTYASDKCVEK